MLTIGARSRRSWFAARRSADLWVCRPRAPRILSAAAQHLHRPAARGLAATTGQPGHAAELLQHLLHLHELLEQTIHLFHRRPAALRDALAAAAIDDVLLPPLIR